MTESTVTFAFIIGALCGALVIAMWLGSRLARTVTDRNRLQAVGDGLRQTERKRIAQILDLSKQRDQQRSDADALRDKVATLTADCVEFQKLAHEAQDGLDMAKDMLSGEMAAHATTKRQLAAAKGQITKMKRRIEG